MADLVCTSDAGAATFSDPVANYMATVGRYWHDAPEPPGADYDLQHAKAPGQVGHNTKDFNFGQREVDNLEVIYVGADAEDCRAAWIEDTGFFAGHETQVDIPDGGEYPGCEFNGGESQVIRGPKVDQGTGNYWMLCRLSFSQKRPGVE